MARLEAIHVQCKNRVAAAVLDPPHHPAQRWLSGFGPEQAALGAYHGIADPSDRQYVAHDILTAFRNRQYAAPQPVDKINLLHRVDAKISGEPELVDAAADVAVAVFEQVEILLHAVRSDAPRYFLIDRHRRCGDCRAHGVVAIPGLDAALHAVPFEQVHIGITHYPGLQRNQRIRDLEGRGRKLRLPRAIAVAGDDKIIFDPGADERAGGPGIREVPAEAIAYLAALERDIGNGGRG